MDGHKKLELPDTHFPKAPCGGCLTDPRMTRENSFMIVSYCVHNRALATLEIKDGSPAGPWRILSPVSIQEATELIGKGTNVIEDFLRKVEEAEEKELAAMPKGMFFMA